MCRTELLHPLPLHSMEAPPRQLGVRLPFIRIRRWPYGGTRSQVLAGRRRSIEIRLPLRIRNMLGYGALSMQISGRWNKVCNCG